MGLRLDLNQVQDEIEEEKDMDEVTFSIGDVAKRSGMSARKIRYLEEKGWIKPVYISIGSTTQRRYSIALLKQIKHISDLRQQGYRLAIAASKVLRVDLTEADSPVG